MVDYVLKIDIDETELVKKLSRALKKAGGLGVGGGASQLPYAQTAGNIMRLGAHMGGLGQQATGAIELTPSSMRDLALHIEKAKATGIERRNLMTYDNQLKIQRRQLSHQLGMERLSKQQGGLLGKLFKGGGVFKLAGLATGVAGLLQLRKMVIDSSPMLQAMLKVLNVGIMFVLRPIGDFFGFVLRPLFIPFVKWAVKFYAGTLKMIPVWTKIGQSIMAAINGEFDQSRIFWEAAMTQWGHLEQYDKLRNEFMKEDSEDGKELSKNELDILKDLKITQKAELDAILNQTRYIPKDIGTAGALSERHEAVREAFKEGGSSFFDDLTKGFNEWWEKTFAPQKAYGDTGSDYTVNEKGGRNLHVGLGETMSLSGDMGAMSGVSTEQANANQRLQEKWMDDQRKAFAAMEKMTVPGFNRQQRSFELGGVSEAELERRIAAEKAAMDEYQASIDAMGQLGLTQEQLEASTAKLQDNLVTSNAMAEKYQMQLDYLTGAIEELTYATKDNTGELEEANKPESSGWTGGGRGTPRRFMVGDRAYGSKVSAIRAGEQLASGGVIDEQVTGWGVRTGKKYTFGEAGDEAIVPANQFYEMAAQLKRIGMGGTIPSGLQNEGVGKFEGVTAFGLQRALDKYNMASEAAGIVPELEQQMSGIGRSRPNYKGVYGSSAKNRRYAEILEWKRTAGKQIQGIGSRIGELRGAETSSMENFASLFQQAGGSTNNATTNNNSINISVSDSSGNIDHIIDQIGPKLLKYLQENEARVGIR